MTSVPSSPQTAVSEGAIAVPGAHLYCREVGSASQTPLVVLHGGPDFNHNYLLPEIDRLATSTRLIYYDQRGRGKSSAGVVPEDVTIESEVDDLDRLRQHFGLDQLALLGHSWGCILALEYATRYPDRVGHVVLMNPPPASHRDLQMFRAHREATEADTLAAMRAIAETRAFQDGDIQAEAEYYRMHFSRAVHRPELIDAIVARLRVHFTPEDILKARAIEERLYERTWLKPAYDLTERLEGFDRPTLVLCGRQDFFPMSIATNVAAASTAAKLAVLDDCGHFAYAERWEAAKQAIESFLG